MKTILGRPLTFGDEEQIKYLQLEQIRDKFSKSPKLKELQSEYYEIDRQIEELEHERDGIYSQIEKLAIKIGIPKNEIYKVI